MISEASGSFHDCVINFLCTQTTVQGNLSLLAENICTALNLPEIHFNHFTDLFAFPGRQNQKFLTILDEYHYLKEGGRKGETDSVMQGIIDRLSNNIRIALCGSYITMMKELLNEENPLFGRFTSVIHLEELDYYDAFRFNPEMPVSDQIAHYAVFGG